MVATLKTSVVQEPSSGTANLTLDASGGVTVGQNLTVAGTTTFTGGSTFTGNATAAAFIPSGSTVPTNGLYRPAANTVGLATNSTNALYIDSSQNVGIGTSSPAYKLDVNSNANVNGTVVMTSPYTMRNIVINGAMQFWQRGTSFTDPTAGGNFYTADRWGANRAGDATGITVSRSTSAPSGFQYSLALQRTAGNSGVAALYLFYSNETVNSIQYQGQNITLSFYAKAGANYSGGSLSLNVNIGTGTDQRVYAYTGSSTIISSSQSITTTWTKYTFTGTVPSNATEIGLNINWTPTGTAGADDAVYITGVQLERGTVATPFEYRNYQQELAMCQRYFVQFGGDSSNDQVGAGQAFSATGAGATVRFPVTMRSNPTLDSFTASNWSVMNGSGGLVAATAIVLGGGQTNRNGTQLSITVASGLTTGQGSSLLANTSSAKLPFNAEL